MSQDSALWAGLADLIGAEVSRGGGATWPTPGALALDLDKRTVQTPALELIDAALVQLLDTPDGRLIIQMPPQEGKSQRVSRRFPLWALEQNPDLRIAIASYEHNVARRWGRAIRDDIAQNAAVLRLQVRADLSAQSEWQLAGRDGGVYSTGLEGALTGRPVDLLIIDDPIKDRLQAESKVYRDRVWDWWTDTASTRLAPGAPVALILTRWHHDDLAGRLKGAPDGHLWRVLSVPAQADHHPDQDQADALGRAPGQFMVSARGRTPAQWEAIHTRVGSRTWASLYQGRPTADTGNLFKRDQWARYTTPPWIVRDDGARIIPEVGHDPNLELVQSWDFTFKDTKGSDYVVGQVWLRRGVDAYLLDQVRARMSFSDSCQAIRDMTARWPQAIAKLVEDKANGPAILNALRATVGGLIPVEPEGSKYARASAITPFVESGNVLLPDPAVVLGTAWVTDLTEEAADFPAGSHDDQVDALSQAVHRLLLVPLLDGSIHDAEDFLDDADNLDLPWAATY